MKLETYTKIFITSVLINLAFLANAHNDIGEVEGKPMAIISFNNTTRNYPVNDNVITNSLPTPFANMIISDLIEPEITINITYTAENGTFENGVGITPTLVGNAGNYNLSGTSADVLTALQALRFDPTDNQIAPTTNPNTVITTFTVRILENAIETASNSEVTVTATSINDEPQIGGILTDPIDVDDDDSVNPFTSITITDADINDVLKATFSFTLDNAGTLSSLGNFTLNGGGEYEMSGSAADIQSNLRNIVFTPEENLFPTPTDVFFPLNIEDESGSGNSDSNTKITINPVNDAPSISGLIDITTPVFDNATDIFPFSNATIQDADNGGQQIVRVTITLNDANNGVLEDLPAGVSGNAATGYIFSGTPTQVTTQIQAITFNPDDNEIPINDEETSIFTVTVDNGDGTANSSDNVSVVVKPFNDPPTFVENPEPFYRINENNDNPNPPAFRFDADAIDPDNPNNPTESLSYSLSGEYNGEAFNQNNLPNWLAFNNNGFLRGTPKDGDDGFYTIIISVSDGENQPVSLPEFAIIVNPVNSVPSFSLNPTAETVNEGASGTVDILDILTYSGNTNNDPNQSIEIDDIQLEVDANSNNPNLFSSLNIEPNNNFEPNIDNRNDLIINYEIAQNQIGTAVVRVTVFDNGSSENFTTREFQINVLADNKPPEIPIDNINPNSLTVKEDIPEQIIISGITAGEGEEESQNINAVNVTVSSLTPDIIRGNPVFELSNKIISGPNKDTYTLTINYLLEENAFGNVDLEIRVEDSSNPISNNRVTVETISINVEPVDDAPVITSQDGAKIGIVEGGFFTLTLDDFIIDHPENEGEGLELVVQDGEGYTKNNNEVTVNDDFGSGVLEVEVLIIEATNNVGEAQSVRGVYRVNISDINTAPVITGQNPNPLIVEEEGVVAIEVINLVVTDDNPTNLYISNISPSADDSYRIENGNEVIPAKDLVGIITVPVTVSDGAVNNEQFSNEYDVIIDVQPVNDDPIITDQFEVTIREEDTYEINVGDLKITDVDNNDDDFTLSIAEGLNYTIINGTIIEANDDFFGTLTIPVQVNDRNDGNSRSNIFDFEITVLPVNDAPTIDDIADRQVPDDNGQTIFVNFSGVEAGPNENGQNLEVTASSGNESLIQEVQVIYTPNQPVGLLRMETIPNREGRTTITVTVKDDGGTVNGGIDTKVVTFDVTVLGQNSAPTLDFISDVNLLEDFEPSPVRLRNIRDGDDGSQIIDIDATSSNTALIPNPSVNYVQGETEGTLTFNPVPGQNGTATITVTVKDDGGTENGGEDTYIVTFEISILGLNDRPTIDAIADTSLLEDTNELVIILTGITDGDLDEVQKMAITATSSRPEIIPDPTVIYDSVSTTAELILNPMPNISGISTITITIKDDGGSIVAGQEDTRTITFQATVLPVNDQPTINPITDVIRFVEGDGTQRQLISGITDGDPELIQIITSVTVTTNKPEFYESLEVAYREGDTNGELIFMTDPDANGMDTLTITVTDNGGTENGGINTVSTLVYVDVIPQNDPPTITNLPGIELPKNADPDCIALSGITDGDPELEQNITVTAVSNRPDIIPDPEISEFKPNAGTATLCYEPLEDARGVVKITITVTDDGNIPASRSIELEINVGENNNPPEIRDENGDALEELNLTTSKDEPLAICFQVIDRDQDEVDLGQIISRNSDAGGEILPGSFTFKDDSLCFIYEAFPNTLSGVDWFEFTICDDVPDDIACDTIRLNIEILPSADLRIYDGISPKNSDGKNDAWFIEGIENYPNNVVQIYSTSGELVYEANGYDNRDTLWRGESNTGIVLGSRELPTGVYYYVIDLNGGSLPPQKGSVIIK